MLMKKIFTLISLAAVALTASAQGTYAIAEGDAPKSTDKITSVPNITLTYGESGGADFGAAVADATLTDFGFTAYTAGNGTNGNKAGGTFYIFEPTVAGKLTVGVVLNAEKSFFIEENGAALDDYNGITVSEKYYGTYTFDVKAVSSFKVYVAGSKLGFYGFVFSTGDTTDIQSVKASANDNAAYDLLGKKVNASYKGIVIKNGKKFIQK